MRHLLKFSQFLFLFTLWNVTASPIQAAAADIDATAARRAALTTQLQGFISGCSTTIYTNEQLRTGVEGLLGLLNERNHARDTAAVPPREVPRGSRDDLPEAYKTHLRHMEPFLDPMRDLLTRLNEECFRTWYPYTDYKPHDDLVRDGKRDSVDNGVALTNYLGEVWGGFDLRPFEAKYKKWLNPKVDYSGLSYLELEALIQLHKDSPVEPNEATARRAVAQALRRLIEHMNRQVGITWRFRETIGLLPLDNIPLACRVQ